MSAKVLTFLPSVSNDSVGDSGHHPLIRMPSAGAVDMPTELVMNKLKEAWPPKCAYVVGEILQTEQVYVNALEDILKVKAIFTDDNVCLLFTKRPSVLGTRHAWFYNPISHCLISVSIHNILL